MRGPHSTKKELYSCFVGTWVSNSIPASTTRADTLDSWKPVGRFRNGAQGKYGMTQKRHRPCAPFHFNILRLKGFLTTEISYSCSLLGSITVSTFSPFSREVSCSELSDECGMARLLGDSRHLTLTVKVVGLFLGLRFFPKPAGGSGDLSSFLKL